MAPFATGEDVAALLQRELTDEEAPAVDLHLVAAEAIIRGVVPNIDDRITAGTLDAAVATYVAASMVTRLMRNPEGWRSKATAIDDFREELTRDPALADGSLRIIETELAMLLPGSTRRRAPRSARLGAGLGFCP